MMPDTLLAVFCIAQLESVSLVHESSALAPGGAVVRLEEQTPYSLFNPKPPEAWRELSADRPDATESPFTVDAGAVQLEMSFVDYTKNSDDRTWSVAPFNTKIGLTESTDIQFVFDPYIYHDPRGGSSTSGVGDVQIRLKWNLWGNVGGNTALAIMPFVKLPTASNRIGNDHVEGGVIVPWSIDLAVGIGLGLMAEFDVVYDEEDDDYDLEFLTTAVLGIDITDALGMYIEGIGITSTDAQFQSLAGFGFTFAVDRNVVLDAGVNIGLTGDADDVNIFVGITVRF